MLAVGCLSARPFGSASAVAKGYGVTSRDLGSWLGLMRVGRSSTVLCLFLSVVESCCWVGERDVVMLGKFSQDGFPYFLF